MVRTYHLGWTYDMIPYMSLRICQKMMHQVLNPACEV